MEQLEFNILVTNVSAVENQTFVVQCGKFSAEESVTDSAAESAESKKFDVDQFMAGRS